MILYKVYVLERGIVARFLTERSAETIVSMWEWQGFTAEKRRED